MYHKDSAGKKNRKYEFLQIKVSKDYSQKGTRVKEVDRDNLELAEGIRAKRELELINGIYGIKQVSTGSQANFLDFMEQEVKKKKTNVDYNSALRVKLSEYLGVSRPTFAEVDQDWCEGFKHFLLTNVRSNTASGYLQAFNLFLNIAIDKKFILISPMTRVKLPRLQETDCTTLDLDEIRLLINTVLNYGGQLQEAFIFSCFTGLRLSDIRKLKWADISGSNSIVRPGKTPDKNVFLPLTEQAQLILDNTKRSLTDNRVFWQFNFNRREISYRMLKWGKKAGLQQRLHFHAGRHTFATIGLTHDIDVYTMKEFLGHSKIDMTMKYAKIVKSKKDREITKFPTL